MIDHETGVNPAEYTGSPQSAAAESTGEPPRPRSISVDKIQLGESVRTGGLLWPMLDDLGGGVMRIRPASVTAVSSARDEHEREIRKVPKVKKLFKPNDPLRGKPGIELNRFTVVMACVEWMPEIPLDVRGQLFYPHQMSDVEMREFFSKHFLPELNLSSDVPPEQELNMTVLTHVLQGLEEVSEVPALEIAAVGKDFTLGLGGSADYSG